MSIWSVQVMMHFLIKMNTKKTKIRSTPVVIIIIIMTIIVVVVVKKKIM